MPTAPQSLPKVAKPFSVSYSKLALFRRCKQQYHWKYVDKFFPPSAIGQVRGTVGHAALAVWHTTYDAQFSMDEAWKIWEAHNLTHGPEWELIEASLLRYFNWSLTQAQDTFKIIRAEQEFQIEYEVEPYTLYHSDGSQSQHTTLLVTGYIDGIVEDRGRLWLLENKFYKRMDNHPLDLDPQVSLYMLAAGLLGFKVEGVIYNIIRVADTKIAVAEPVVRRKLHRNLEGLQHIQAEIISQAREMIQYHEGGTPYRNATKDCHWDCPFYSACLLYTDDGNHPTDVLKSLSQTRSQDNGEQVKAIEQE